MSDQTSELLLAVGRLEGKMDSMQSSFSEASMRTDAQLSAIAGEHRSLEERVRYTEKMWARVLGASAVISFLVPYVTHLLTGK